MVVRVVVREILVSRGQVVLLLIHGLDVFDGHNEENR